MADYIYLLENRLSAAQRSALQAVREIARLRSLTVFLVGGAVRDLTSGSPVRDLDVVIQGNALELRKDLESAGAVVSGELEAGQALFLRFPGSVRMEVGSTLAVTFPKPGKPVARAAGIQEDLRRRDFTANAMALSLNEGSYGLLIDPLNGAADIENRELRLVSNYGFIEDPVRMIRATRLMARLGWTMEEKTQARYENSKLDDHISLLSDFHRGYELEEMFHEEDPLRVMRRLESEGWMTALSPVWNATKVNEAELERLRGILTQLEVQGVRTSGAAATFPLLTARLSSAESGALKALFPRAGFVAEVDSLESETRDFAAQLGGKAGAQPSHAWKLIMGARPEVVLWAAFSLKNPAVQLRFKSFFNDWPQARSRMPYAIMAEMRITPELPDYEALLEKLFFELMDGRLATPEEMKAFLEPYSPPAPPPPVSLRRPRAGKKEGKGGKSRSKAKAAPAESPGGDNDADDEERDDQLSPAIHSDLAEALEDEDSDLSNDVDGEALPSPVASKIIPGLMSPVAKASKPAAVSEKHAVAKPSEGRTASDASVSAHLPVRTGLAVAPGKAAANTVPSSRPASDRTKSQAVKVAATGSAAAPTRAMKAPAAPSAKPSPKSPTSGHSSSNKSVVLEKAAPRKSSSSALSRSASKTASKSAPVKGIVPPGKAPAAVLRQGAAPAKSAARPSAPHKASAPRKASAPHNASAPHKASAPAKRAPARPSVSTGLAAKRTSTARAPIKSPPAAPRGKTATRAAEAARGATNPAAAARKSASRSVPPAKHAAVAGRRR